MVEGKINRGRQTNHPAGRHSIRTNQCPPPQPSHFFTGWMPFLPPDQQCHSTEGNVNQVDKVNPGRTGCPRFTRNKPVGFYDPIAPPVPNAPCSDPWNDEDATFVDPHICCRLPLHNAATLPVLLLHDTIGGRLPEWQTSKCISSVSFFEWSRISFYNTQETQTQKMMDQNLEIRILSFLKNFLKFSKRRRADLDHYGRGQTRSE